MMEKNMVGWLTPKTIQNSCAERIKHFPCLQNCPQVRQMPKMNIGQGYCTKFKAFGPYVQMTPIVLPPISLETFISIMNLKQVSWVCRRMESIRLLKV